MKDRGNDRPVAKKASARLYSRSDFLKGIGAAGAGAAIGSNVFVDEALGQSGFIPKGQLEPTDLTFSIAERYRRFDLLSDNFVELNEGFGSDTSGDYQLIANDPENNAGRSSFGDGFLSVSGNDPYFNLYKSTATDPLQAPYGAVIVDVERFANSGGEQDTVFAGLIKDQQNYVLAFYSNSGKVTGIDVRVNGNLQGFGFADADLNAPARFAFVVTSKEVAVYAFDNGEWLYLTSVFDIRKLVDLRDPAVLAEYRYGFGIRASSGTITLDGVQAGYYGALGTRDQNIVTYSNGSPYIQDGKLYLTQTNAGLNDIPFAHWGVYRLDLSDYTNLEEVGKIFFERDGKRLGDHAGHLAFNEDTGRFDLYASTWGDIDETGFVDTSYAEVGPEILSGVDVVTNPQILDMPTQNSSYDPYPVSTDGQWYLAYTDTTDRQISEWVFFPALAVGPSPSGPFNAVGKDPSATWTEGTKIQKVGGEFYVFSSKGPVDGTNSPDDRYPIYDLEMEFVGNLDAPHPTAIPHPSIVPLSERGRTRYIMITFDGTKKFPEAPDDFANQRGDFYVMEAAETTRSREFPSRGKE